MKHFQGKRETRLLKKVKCDFCDEIAWYDGKTTSGYWAYMCKLCFILNGIGLGTGVGQKLIYIRKESSR